MKPNSRRGVALAYVIVITAVLLVLAAALISVANFNLGSSQNSLEGRQAYLDAKSAIEYGREYLNVNPDAASANFYIVRNGSNPSGFSISSNTANAVAVYDSTTKSINAAAKYKSSDRVRKLGYQFETEDNPSSPSNSINDFLVGGGGYGTNMVLSYYTQNMYPNAKSDYPFISVCYRQTQEADSLTAPQIYILGTTNGKTGDSLKIYDHHSLVLRSDFIYLVGGVSSFNDSMPLYLKTIADKATGVIYFGRDILINGKVIAKGGQYYYFKNGMNLYSLRSGDLAEIPDGELPNVVNLDRVDFILDNLPQIYSGDIWGGDYAGVDWCSHGTFTSNRKARYIIYKKAIDPNNWINDGNPIIENYNAGLSDYEQKIIYWYITDTTNWANSLWGNNSPSSNDYFTNVSNVYLAKELNLRYVNGAKNDFTVPKYKTVVLKADKITLNTEYSDTEIGSGTSRPKITHDGDAARFILEAQNASDNTELYIPNAVVVQYKNTGGITKSYTIQPGYYDVRQLNLFSDDAKDYFASNPPTDAPDGGSGGSGGSGGGTLTGGVYTNG